MKSKRSKSTKENRREIYLKVQQVFFAFGSLSLSLKKLRPFSTAKMFTSISDKITLDGVLVILFLKMTHLIQCA